MSIPIGIDIGTSHFSGAIMLRKKFYMIVNENGAPRIPSIVTFITPTHHVIGQPLRSGIQATLYNTKRILGRKYTDPIVQKIKKRCQFEINHYDGDKTILNVRLPRCEMPVRPEDAQSLFICHLKDLAKQLGHPVDRAVIAVPAYYDEDQRRAAVDSCYLAGLKMLTLINEPTAALLAHSYFISPIVEAESNCLVFDMGSSLNITIITVDNFFFKLRATTHDEFYNGDHFNKKIINYMINYIRSNHDKDFTMGVNNELQMQLMAESAKYALADLAEVPLNINDDGLEYNTIITRDTFEMLCDKLMVEARSYLDATLLKAGMQKQDIHRVITVGSGCKMSMIKNMLSAYFGLEAEGNSEMCDKLVTFGAAIQASLLMAKRPGHVHDLLPVDILPNSLGVNVRDDMLVVMKKGAKLPCTERTRVTCGDRLSANVFVYEGENKNPIKNTCLGILLSNDVKSEQPIIVDAIFEVDVYCTLNVTLHDIVTDKFAFKTFHANTIKKHLKEASSPSTSKSRK